MKGWTKTKLTIAWDIILGVASIALLIVALPFIVLSNLIGRGTE